MGRRERKREATRNQIIEAAKALFDERRYDDVTIDEITNRADVAKGTFYLHFRTKDDVAAEVYNEVVRPAVDAVNQAITAESSARDLIESFFQAFATPTMSNPRLAQAVLSHSMSHAYAEPEEEDDLWSITLMKIVELGLRNGEFRPDWTGVELSMILGSVFGTTLWAWTALPSKDSLPERLRRCVETCFEGVGARPLPDCNTLN